MKLHKQDFEGNPFEDLDAINQRLRDAVNNGAVLALGRSVRRGRGRLLRSYPRLCLASGQGYTAAVLDLWPALHSQICNRNGGAGSRGKSTLVPAEALAICTGRPLLRIKPAEQCNVWLWNGEDPADEIERRIASTMAQHRVTSEEVQGRICNSGRQQPIVIAEQTKTGIKIAEPLEKDLVQMLQDLKIGVMIVDPFISCHRVPENDNGAMDAVTKTWARSPTRRTQPLNLSFTSEKPTPTNWRQTTFEAAAP